MSEKNIQTITHLSENAFSIWFDQLLKDRKQYALYKGKTWRPYIPPNLNDWQRDVIEAKTVFPEGVDTIVVRNIELKHNPQTNLPNEGEHTGICRQIFDLIPGYRISNGHCYPIYCADLYYESYQEFMNPSKIGKKFSKDIAQYMKSANIDDKTKNEVNRLLARLGEIRADYFLKHLEVDLVISKDPRAFAMIGETNADRSCFSFSSENSAHKMLLGVLDHSFVCWVTSPGVKLNEVFDHRNEDIVGRFWGIVDESKIYCFNYYAIGKLRQGHLHPLAEEVYRQLLNTKVETSVGPVHANAENIFLNSDSCVVVEKGVETEKSFNIQDKWQKSLKSTFYCNHEGRYMGGVSYTIDNTTYSEKAALTLFTSLDGNRILRKTNSDGLFASYMYYVDGTTVMISHNVYGNRSSELSGDELDEYLGDYFQSRATGFPVWYPSSMKVEHPVLGTVSTTELPLIEKTEKALRQFQNGVQKTLTEACV